MNMKSFYDSVRHSIFGGSFSSKQLAGMEAIIKEYNNLCVNDLRKLAYILATAFHETSYTMQPINEYLKGKGKPYGSKIKMSGAKYTSPDKLYYGRGLVQLTWYENYKNMGRILGYDLLNNPELLLTMEVSVKVMFEGMLKAKSNFGDFTGKSLDDYINNKGTDFLNARRVVNGTDKAKTIAGYADKFYIGLILK